jgi:hypothetical protein
MDKVIGIGGQLANGKDVVADYLVLRLNETILDGEDRWQRLGFAHAVKQVFMDSFGVDWDFIEHWKRIPEPPPGFDMRIRQALQQIGDGFRKIKATIWLDIAFRKEGNYVISDVRYINEVKRVRKEGGINVLVWRPGFENDDPNPSESEILRLIRFFRDLNVDGKVSADLVASQPYRPDGAECVDYFIRNDGDLNHLYNKVDACLLP